MDNQFDKEKFDDDKALWEFKRRQASQSRLEAILRLYSVLGALATVIGIASFTILTLDIKLSEPQLMALLVAGSGFMLSIASWTLLYLRRTRLSQDRYRLQTTREMSDFVMRWGQFEAAAREYLDRSGVAFNRYSIREIISALRRSDVITEADALGLEEAISARNIAVHGGDAIPKAVVRRCFDQLNSVIAKLNAK